MINAKGTSVPSFRIGKTGVTMYQGSVDPTGSNTPQAGDYWFDSSINALHVWSGTAWQAPRIADLVFTNSSITAPAASNLTLSVDSTHYVVIDAGVSGAALVTTSGGQDLHINPATGGGQYLYFNANRWPTTAGSSGQVLTTDPLGILSWTTFAPHYEEQVAGASQTVFNTTLQTLAKTSLQAYLQVFVNGIFQQEGAARQFTVTGPNQITFNTAVPASSDVVIYGYA